MSEAKKEYVVIKPNTRNHKVGDRIRLTDREASKLVNKVRLADELAPRPADDESAKALEAKETELQDLRAKLNESAKALEVKETELQKVTDELNELKLANMTGGGDQGAKGSKK